jgi:cytoskeleton protein RodZ
MNTHTTVPPETSAPASRVGGPGNQLRQARLDLKLTPENVAHILHLSPRQIVALENDDYGSLPGPTYVRGYLRGYAQLLGLSAEPVLETYSRSVAASKPVDLSKLAPKPEIRSDHQLIKFATVGVIVIVLSLSALWWQERDKPSPPPAPQSLDRAADSSVDTEEKADSVGTVPDTTLATPDARNTAAAKPAPAAPVVTPERPVVRESPAPVVTPAPIPTTPVDGPRMRLVIQVPADCWADIRDAGGNRLLYETIRAGHTAVVEGVAPLAVFLGNVEGIRIEANGQPYDVSAYRRGDVARFTVGENR